MAFCENRLFQSEGEPIKFGGWKVKGQSLCLQT